jgi:3-hydroxyisobutyrate dehydrogenase/2-hydroxy-3-oxopropionate reductase
MARNLLRAGYEVAVRSNTAAKTQELAAAEKGKFCTTPRQVAEYAAGMGLQAKLTQNLILSNLLMAFNEGMVLATKGGVDPELMLEILDSSAARSGLISYKAPFVLGRNFTTNFSVKWMEKDIGLMLESGQELGVPLLLTGLTRQLFRTAIAAGHGEEDMCSTIKVLESSSGVEVVFQK